MNLKAIAAFLHRSEESIKNQIVERPEIQIQWHSFLVIVDNNGSISLK